MVTALTFGKPPKAGWQAARAAKRAMEQADSAELEQYADVMLTFRAWCQRRDVAFKQGVMQAVAIFQMLVEEQDE